jgi:hypothetical protein
MKYIGAGIGTIGIWGGLATTVAFLSKTSASGAAIGWSITVMAIAAAWATTAVWHNLPAGKD